MAQRAMIPQDSAPHGDETLGERGGVKTGRLSRLVARFGLAAFVFFTIKGLLWLIIPAVIAVWTLR